MFEGRHLPSRALTYVGDDADPCRVSSKHAIVFRKRTQFIYILSTIFISITLPKAYHDGHDRCLLMVCFAQALLFSWFVMSRSRNYFFRLVHGATTETQIHDILARAIMHDSCPHYHR